MSPSLKDHWNEKYANSPTTQLGWYEAEPTPSIALIEKCGVPRQSAIFDIGSGASTLIPALLELGYQNLYAVDISEIALEKAQSALTGAQLASVHWLVEDITQPSARLQHANAAIWHDRAVFHFLTEEEHRKTYLELIQKVLMPGGFAVIATFALDGATKCSGLPVQRYSAESLSEFLGAGFKLIERLDYTYQMPSGDLRPYLYTRFQKISS
jgi:SAM-dependent methyltransferase